MFVLKFPGTLKVPVLSASPGLIMQTVPVSADRNLSNVNETITASDADMSLKMS